MKMKPPSRYEAAMTLFEAAVVIAIVMVLAMLLLAALASAKRKTSRILCTNNLKQIGLAYRIWAGDNGDLNPMGVSVTHGGSMELVQMGDAVSTFQVMSNELGTTKILVCCGNGDDSGDTSRTFATNFTVLSNSNVSYLVGVDATNEIHPQLILSGDSNFEIGGKPVKAGLLSLWKNDPVAWQPPRHGANGNLGFADGHVQSTTASGLRARLVQTGLATNRLAIPLLTPSAP